MKKIITLAIAALATMSLSAQQRVMRIHLSDGTSVTHPVDDVTRITFETNGDTPPDDPSAQMVDMGLSVKWAAWNVGADAIDEAGNFYAYGEIEPKQSYTYETYLWRYPDYDDWDCDEWEKYFKLGATITGTPYDVAHVKLGDLWRMPTRQEWDELILNCTWTKTGINGVTGMLATSKINGNTLFFPCAGNMIDEGHTHDGTNAFLWTATEYIQDDITRECRNYRACLDATYQRADGYDYPECGFNVRPVYGPVAEEPLPEVKQPDATTMVDLGLSVKWASMNLGAKSPSGTGLYLCWGELRQKQYTHVYNYSLYDPWEDAYLETPLNICGNAGMDPATAYWGDGWRLPSIAEMQELINLCTWEPSGSAVKVTGPNGNSIIIPACGMETYKGVIIRGTEDVNIASGETRAGADACRTTLVVPRSGSGFGTPVMREWSARAGGLQVRPVHN